MLVFVTYVFVTSVLFRRSTASAMEQESSSVRCSPCLEKHHPSFERKAKSQRKRKRRRYSSYDSSDSSAVETSMRDNNRSRIKHRGQKEDESSCSKAFQETSYCISDQKRSAIRCRSKYRLHQKHSTQTGEPSISTNQVTNTAATPEYKPKKSIKCRMSKLHAKKPKLFNMLTGPGSCSSDNEA